TAASGIGLDEAGIGVHRQAETAHTANLTAAAATSAGGHAATGIEGDVQRLLHAHPGRKSGSKAAAGRVTHHGAGSDSAAGTGIAQGITAIVDPRADRTAARQRKLLRKAHGGQALFEIQALIEHPTIEKA